MAVPGWGTVAGVAAKFIDRWSDPVRKKEALKDERAKLLKGKVTPSTAQRVAVIDDLLVRLQKDIDRRSAS